jgi:hypothetical protein
MIPPWQERFIAHSFYRDVCYPDTCMRDGVVANNSADGEIFHRMAALGLRIAQ